ncbi:MAG TPA: hypothetical protein VMW72_08050 [Sedimentisphaerales bacterium]|nr:hypothetical protein [Sedimentisphaerales bacterium]
MKRKTMKASWLAVATLIFSVFIGDVFADATIVRGEINIDDGPDISFSVPVSLLQALKTSGISAMVENKEELCRLIDSLMGELESMKDNHLLILKAKNEVEAHVWVEEANRDEPMRANFVFVNIAPGNHEPEVSLRLPQGVFFLCSFIGNQFVEVHGKEALGMIRQLFLTKIKEKDRGQDHEPPRPDLQPIEEMHQRIGHLKDKIDLLRREGRHEEAKGLEREVDDIRRKIEEIERGPGHEQPHQEPSQSSEYRTRILNEAVDNMFKAVQKLHEADKHELAEQLAREAEKFRGEIHK